MAVAISRTADPAGAGSGTTITYSATAIGAADEGRIVVVCVGTELTSGTPSSATLNFGTGALAMNASALATFGVMGSRVFWLPAPTGTTADIAVTFGASQGATTHHLCVYRVLGAAVESTGTATSTDMDVTAPLTTGSLTIRASGGFIGVAVGAADAVGKTWANATEDLDEDAGTFQFTTATRATALAATAVTCTGATNAEDGALAWILLRPGVVANAGSYALTGTSATLTKGHPIAVDAGSYALSGTAATLTKGHPIAAGSGSYAVTGTTATLKRTYVLAAGAGSYALTGSTASALHGWKLSVDAGSYILTGTDATLTKAGAAGFTLSADAGSYALTGTVATLRHAWVLAADAGSYAVTGTTAGLLHKYVLAAGAGSYALTGSTASLRRNVPMVAVAGSYALTGSTANLVHRYVLSAGAGSYTLTGTDANLIKAGAGNKVLPANAGSYALTGSTANLLHRYLLSADAGSYAITGTAASLVSKKVLTALAASYTLTGSSAALVSKKLLAALAASYAVTGNTASLIFTKLLTALAGSYVLTGSDAGIASSHLAPEQPPPQRLFPERIVEATDRRPGSSLLGRSHISHFSSHLDRRQSADLTGYLRKRRHASRQLTVSPPLPHTSANTGGTPVWVPETAKIFIDFVNDRAWTEADGEVAISTLLGNDPVVDNSWDTSGYDSDYLIAGGYNAYGSGVVTSYLGAARDMLLTDATMRFVFKRTSTTGNAQSLFLISEDGNNYLEVIQNYVAHSLSLASTYTGTLAIVDDAFVDAVDAVNAVAITITNTRFEAAGNGNTALSGTLTEDDRPPGNPMAGVFFDYKVNNYALIQSITIYDALPSTAGLSALSETG